MSDAVPEKKKQKENVGLGNDLAPGACQHGMPMRGYLLVDSHLNIVAQDPEAEAMLCVPGGELFADEGRLQCRDHGWHHTLEDLLGQSRTMSRRRASMSPRGNLRVEVRRMRHSPRHFGSIVSLVTLKSAVPMDAAMRVAAEHGLTEAEAQILAGICRGRRLCKIAADRHVVVETVRTQLKSALGKLNVHSQVEAVTMVFQADLVERSQQAG